MVHLYAFKYELKRTMSYLQLNHKRFRYFMVNLMFYEMR